MLVIGLTGGIGMGKSTAAKILRDFGLPVYYADRAVHKLLSKNGKAVKSVAKVFPVAFERGAINRKILGQLVFHHPAKLRALEKILHPLVRKAEDTFLKTARAKKTKAVILEIPLLFETGGQKRCNFTICVTASRAVQKARVMQRPGMTGTRLWAILKRQMSDQNRQKRADYVVNTGKSRSDTRQQLKRILSPHNLIGK